MSGCPGHDAADSSGRYYPDIIGGGGNTISSFADMIAEYSTDDLFELAWEQGGGSGGASGSTSAVAAAMPQPAASHLWSPPAPPWSDYPPSESEMAAWLRAIVNGEELAFGDKLLKTTVAGVGDRPDVAAAAKGSTETWAMEEKEKLIPVMEGMMGSGKEMRKLPAGGSSRRSSQHGEAAHNLTEKRRRHKINERLRTLQQLVPGCDDKSNQASTLDQTIQYMKSLKHHVQAMSFGPARPYPVVSSPMAPAVAMPMPPAAPMVLAPAAPAMVPFGAMLHLPGGHYPVGGVHVIMPAAAAAPLYPPAAPPRAAVALPGAAGSSSSAGHRQGSSSSCKGKGGSRSLRRLQKQ